jgi:hypothetical protein
MMTINQIHNNVMILLAGVRDRKVGIECVEEELECISFHLKQIADQPLPNPEKVLETNP